MDGRLYIVSGKKTREAAEYLETRVDASALPVAGERTELWSVREYLKGAEALAPGDALVFVGAADAWAEETAGGAACIDAYGMRCVAKGLRALLTAEEKPIEGRKERRAFLAWLRERCPAVGDEAIAVVEAERKIALFDSIRATVNPWGTVMEQQLAVPAVQVEFLHNVHHGHDHVFHVPVVLGDRLAGIAPVHKFQKMHGHSS